MCTLDPIARSSTELGARDQNQNMMGGRMGRGGRPEAMTMTATILTCHVMQITMKISAPTLSLNQVSYWYRRQGALGVHKLSGAGHCGISSLGKKAMRLPPPGRNPREPPRYWMGRTIQKPCKDTHLSRRKFTTPASGWATMCYTSALDPSISSPTHTLIHVERQTLGTPLLSLSSLH